MDKDVYKAFDDISTWQESQITKENLLQHIADKTGITKDKVRKWFPHNSSDTDEKIIEIIRKYINYANKHLMSLPTETPEELIWDDELCKLKLQQILLNEELASTKYQEIIATTDYKQKFSLLAKFVFGDDVHSGEFECLHKEFISRWINKNDKTLLQIKVNILDKII